MSGGNRAPSSSVKKPTASGRSNSTPALITDSITSRPANTPRFPSKRPPVATVSIWEPVITGDNPDGCGIVAMTLPTPSIEMSRPRSRIHFTTRSRPWPSSAVRARRADPRSPSAPTIAPISASSSRRCNKRSPLTARFTPESLRTLLHFVKAFQLRDQFALTPFIATLARCHQGVPPRVPPPPCR